MSVIYINKIASQQTPEPQQPPEQLLSSAHTLFQARAWWQQKFGQRVISRHMDRPWPAKSPDLSPLDYWFWSVATRELARVPPSSIEEIKTTD